MKKLALIAMVCSIALTSYSQKKKNGTIYSEHPAIVVVEAMQQAYVDGDADKVGSYLAEDFKSWNGSGVDPNAKGGTKEQYLNQVEWWSENISYLSIERMQAAYPDAIEFKDEEGGIWVQTWDVMKGVHTATGSKINMPIHRLFEMDDDNKIRTMITYVNDEVYGDVGRSFDVRENGKVYDQHTYINKVKLGFAAFENGDLETAYGLFADNAVFRSSSMVPGDDPANMEQFKASNESFLNTYDIISIDMNGYPDLIHYARNDVELVQSWWTFRLIRKSDQKKFVLPAFYTHEFDDDGMISSVNSYINLKLLDD